MISLPPDAIMWLIALLMALLTSCSSGQPREAIALQPAMAIDLPVVTVQRPRLEIHGLSHEEKSQPDTLAKAYVATVVQLLDYSRALESVVEQLQRFHTQEYAP